MKGIDYKTIARKYAAAAGWQIRLLRSPNPDSGNTEFCIQFITYIDNYTIWQLRHTAHTTDWATCETAAWKESCELIAETAGFSSVAELKIALDLAV